MERTDETRRMDRLRVPRSDTFVEENIPIHSAGNDKLTMKYGY